MYEGSGSFCFLVNQNVEYPDRSIYLMLSAKSVITMQIDAVICAVVSHNRTDWMKGILVPR